MDYVNISQACYADLVPLSRALGHEEFFTERFGRQKNGRGALYIAWLDDVPVGDVYLWLEAAEEYDIRRYLPDAALLTHLEVLPRFRNRGIGTQLITAVEKRVRDDGHQQAALAVVDDNDKAVRLYQRLGYADWGRGKVFCIANATRPDGNQQLEVELCYVMVKELHSINPS